MIAVRTIKFTMYTWRGYVTKPTVGCFIASTTPLTLISTNPDVKNTPERSLANIAGTNCPHNTLAISITRWYGYVTKATVG